MSEINPYIFCIEKEINCFIEKAILLTSPKMTVDSLDATLHLSKAISLGVLNSLVKITHVINTGGESVSAELRYASI